ncbi:MAG TPA: protein kinase [Pyrinomonadaceae bacterium]|nr:protein kinase [Pyrinomonadaceae bacterium]
MSTIEWNEVEEVFQAALEIPPADRNAWLTEHCGADPELRREVESLLAAESASADFLSTSDLPRAASMLLSDQTELAPAGRHIGPFTILKELGRGGMGVVYLAARDQNEFRQTVALKLIRRGLDTDDILRRFRNERQILASLNHPNIGKLFEGGTTDDGLPYFVMEYIDGLQLLQYCNERGLSIADRLNIFRSVCAAVQHAHQNLIIHRDLKPSNILVTAAGEVKLLDFGVAKVLNPDLADGPLTQTRAAARVMTPEYASPEQVRGQHVTTATDIYSLGVILYELLTGTRPFKLKDTSPEEISRAICDAEPSKPSQAVSGQLSEPAAVAGGPKSDTKKRAGPLPQAALTALRGDLDNIILMALRKDPARRYKSVEQFSEDIRRHLDGLPVIAVRDTFSYRAGKLIKRHKLGFAAVLVIVLALLGGVVATLWQARRARQERDKAQYINAFLQNMLGAAAPESKGADVKVTDVLGDASRRAKTDLAGKPEVMADVLMTIGKTYISLGLYAPAEATLRDALNASLQANGELNHTTATCMGWLGLALLYENKSAEGEKISRRAVELHRRLNPQGDEDLGVALYSLGGNMISEGQAKAAEPILQEASEHIKKHLGENNGYYMATLVMLARARQASGNGEGAESLYRQAIIIGSHVEYRYRIFVGQAEVYLGELLTAKGEYSEAEKNLLDSENIYREVSQDSSIAAVKGELGFLYFKQADYAKAENEYRTALEMSGKTFPPEHPLVILDKTGLGLSLTRLGKPAEGEPYLREALETRKKILPPDDVFILLSESALGECLTAEKRYQEAEKLLADSYEGIKSKLGDQDPRTLEAHRRLLNLREGQLKPTPHI